MESMPRTKRAKLQACTNLLPGWAFSTSQSQYET